MKKISKQNIKVLIIDDDLIVQATIKSVLKKIQHSQPHITVSLTEAHSIAQALKCFEVSVTTGSKYDLIFLDLSIDEINDGFELIPIIKTHSKDTHVVVITASLNHSTTLGRSFSVGANGYIKKPITMANGKFEEILLRIAKLRNLEDEMRRLKM